MDHYWTEKGGTSLSAQIRILTRKSVTGMRHRQVAGYYCTIYPLTQQEQFPAPTMRCSIYLPCHGATVGFPQLRLNCFPSLLRINELLFTVSPPCFDDVWQAATGTRSVQRRANGPELERQKKKSASQEKLRVWYLICCFLPSRCPFFSFHI